MIPLHTILDEHVAPRGVDDILNTCHRAINGARLIGGLSVAAAAEEGLAVGVAATLLRWLRRPQTGLWGRATRQALLLLDGDHPLAEWKASLPTNPLAQERALDRWVTDYESSLRHSGRRPPPGCAARVHEELCDGISRLCRQLAEGPPLHLDGSGHETVAVHYKGRFTIAPLVELVDDELWLWDGKSGSKSGMQWIRLHPTEAALTGEDRQADHREVGVTARLHDAAGGDPLETYLDPARSSSPLGLEEGLTVMLTRHAPDEVAEDLAREWKSDRRPVVVLPYIEDGLASDTSAELLLRRLGLLVSEAANVSPGSAFRRWRAQRAGLEPTVVLLAGRRVMPPGLELVQERLGATARVVAVVNGHVFKHQWPSRDRVKHAVGDADAIVSTACSSAAPEAPDLPAEVEARLRAGAGLQEAWEEAATETFDLVDVEHLRRLLDILDGKVGLLEDDDALRMWQEGLLEVAPVGSVDLCHAGWRALVAGARGEAAPAGHDEAWRAGAALARHHAP